MWLFQAAPYFFVNRFDGITWLFMQTGIHQWLIDNPTGWVIADTLFYAMPLTWYIIDRYHPQASIYAAICWLIINWFYVQFYTLFPTNSIEGHVGWLLMPLVFAARRLKTFYFLMHGLRYFFLFFFVSAAIWKFRLGGLFYPQQMSGILLLQHGNYLISAPGSWFAQLVTWLVQNERVGYTLYLVSALLELAFIIGFFTKQFDKWLVAGLILFLVMDFFIMRIPYFEILPMSLTFLFSKYTSPENNNA